MPTGLTFAWSGSHLGVAYLDHSVGSGTYFRITEDCL